MKAVGRQSESSPERAKFVLAQMPLLGFASIGPDTMDRVRLDIFLLYRPGPDAGQEVRNPRRGVGPAGYDSATPSAGLFFNRCFACRNILNHASFDLGIELFRWEMPDERFDVPCDPPFVDGDRACLFGAAETGQDQPVVLLFLRRQHRGHRFNPGMPTLFRINTQKRSRFRC
jgi:hypothetical protein